MKTKKRIIVELYVVTDKDELTIHRAIVRGLYMGFDSSLYRVAQPSDINVIDIKIS